MINQSNISKYYKNSAIAIGNFDGVHAGHQKVFQQTKKIAKKMRVKFGVLTFTPLPVMFFNKKIKNYRLVSEKQKVVELPNIFYAHKLVWTPEPDFTYTNLSITKNNKYSK